MRLIDILPVPFFAWSEKTYIGHAIREATWLFAIIETVHIIGLSILLGTTLIVDLRLLGFGLRRSSIAQVSRELEPWTLTCIVVVVGTGICLYLSEATRLSDSGPFFYKMVLLIIALAAHFTIHRRATSENAVEGSLLGEVAACLSLMCWFGMALAGRAIAYF